MFLSGSMDRGVIVNMKHKLCCSKILLPLQKCLGDVDTYMMQQRMSLCKKKFILKLIKNPPYHRLIFSTFEIFFIVAL